MADVPMITGEVTVILGDEKMAVTVTVPAGPAPMSDLLPLFNRLSSTLAERGAARDAERGRTVSCRAGCGACCRQPAPLAPAEARAMAALVAALPEPRQTLVRQRFATGQAAFAAAGVRVRGDGIFGPTVDAMRAQVDAYMAAHVACPFLIDEACSIYPDRPTVCREYLVTSPAENCASPEPETIDRVEIAGFVSGAVSRVDRELEGVKRVLMVDALDWVAEHPAPVPVKTGPELIQAVFARLGEKN
jgi:Fe-S-cluster containining protein